MSAPFNLFMIGPFPRDATRIEGGVSASVYGLAMALRRHPGIGHVQGISIPTRVNPTLAATRMYDLNGISITPYEAPYLFLSSAVLHVPSMLSRIRQSTHPLVHLHGTGLLQMSLMLGLRLHRIPCVWTLHGITARETWQQFSRERKPRNALRNLLYAATERLMLRIAKHIIVDTEYVKRALPARFSGKIRIIPQGIFLEEFSHFMPLAHMEPVILSLGVIDARKGHHLTIEAFKQLHDRLPEARLIIAGSLKTTRYAWKLHQRIAELDLLHIAQIQTNLRRDKILSMLQRAQIVTLHSREESQGIALCEAMAAGVPVVASRIGGIPDIVRDGQDGLLFTYGDTQAQTNAFAHILTSETARQQMSDAVRKHAEQFDWRLIAARVMEVYAAARTL